MAHRVDDNFNTIGEEKSDACKSRRPKWRTGGIEEKKGKERLPLRAGQRRKDPIDTRYKFCDQEQVDAPSIESLLRVPDEAPSIRRKNPEDPQRPRTDPLPGEIPGVVSDEATHGRRRDDKEQIHLSESSERTSASKEKNGRDRDA